MALALPEGPRGRALALGLTVVVLAVLWLGAGQPLLDAYAERADAIQERAMLAARMEAIAASLPTLQREATGQSADTTPADATLEGATDALAGASLQSRVEAMSNNNGGHLTSTEALPAEQVGAYRRIALRVAVDATWPVLIRMMQAIDRATPRMFVDDLQVHAQPAPEKVHEPPLDISFTILAFRAAPAEAQRASASASSPAGNGP